MKKYFLLNAIFLFSIFSLFPMGNSDKIVYQEELTQLYPQLVKSISNGELSASQAKNQLEALRNTYKISYNDEAGIVDVFIDQLDKGKITGENAILYFSYLKDKKIPDLRRDEGNHAVLDYQKDLLIEYEKVIEDLFNNNVSIDQAIHQLESFQRQSGFLRNRLFVKLQTFLISYRSELLTEFQMRNKFAQTKRAWESSIEKETAKGNSKSITGDDDDDDDNDDNDDDDNDDNDDDDDDDDGDDDD